MSRTVVLLAATLGVIGSMLVLPVSDANAAFCAKPPKLGFQAGDCQKYQCVRRGPCQVGRSFTRRGCLRYLCTTMVGPRVIPDRNPNNPVDPPRRPSPQR